MKKLYYYTVDPSKNVTAIVVAPDVEADKAGIAAEIMQADPTVEQVGFLTSEEGEYRLNMAGGEFCGNASISAAAIISRFEGIKAGETKTILLNVSGNDDVTRVDVTSSGCTLSRCVITMPDAVGFLYKTLPCGKRKIRLPVVSFSGIAHVLIMNGEITESEAEECIKNWCGILDVTCLGIMFLDMTFNRLKPLVYVPAADTLVWESSCASGTAAVGAYLFKTKKAPQDITLDEPGGKLRITAGCNGLALENTALIKEKRYIEY